MSIQLYIADGRRITLDELIDAVPGSQAAREVTELRGLVDHVLGQFDRMDAGESLGDDEDARSWEKRARAVRGGLFNG